MSQNKKQKMCAVNTALPAQRRQFCYIALWWYVCYWLFRLHTGCWFRSCTYHGNRVAVMSVGPDGRVLSIGTEEDLFAYGWEWKAVVWLRGHQLMHPELPHVHRASFNYATFSVTLNSRLFFCFLPPSETWVREEVCDACGCFLVFGKGLSHSSLHLSLRSPF